MRFLGNIEAKADDKGRVFLPAQFRKALLTAGNETLVVRMDVFQSCLVIYPESVWNQQTDWLRSHLSRWRARDQQIYRQFVSAAAEITLDSSGRMLIPRRLLQAAGINREMRFIGMGDTIEIWGGADERNFMDKDEFAGALEDIMNGSGSTADSDDRQDNNKEK